MEKQIQRGNIIEAGEVDATYPFSPSDLRHYGLTPINGDCGHLDGVVSGYQRRITDLAHLHVRGAQGCTRHVVYTAPGCDCDRSWR